MASSISFNIYVKGSIVEENNKNRNDTPFEEIMAKNFLELKETAEF